MAVEVEVEMPAMMDERKMVLNRGCGLHRGSSLGQRWVLVVAERGQGSHLFQRRCGLLTGLERFAWEGSHLSASVSQIQAGRESMSMGQ